MSAISNWLPTPPDNFSTTLSSSINTSALSIPLNSVSGLGTEGVGVLFRKDSNGDVVAGSIEFIHWTNISGSNLTLTNTGDRGLTGSDAGAQSYSAGDFFEIWVSSYYYDSQRDGFTVEHNQDGTHKAAALDAMVSGTEANGDLIYRTGGAWTRLPVGSNTQVLSVSSGAPAWTNPDGWTLYSGSVPTTGTFDAPSYPVVFSGVDLTGVLKEGMRVKITQSTDKYFLITKVAFSTDTTVTLYGGTDYTLVASGTTAITAFSYSREKLPTNFPVDPNKWTVETTDTSNRSQATPTQNTWYNLGSVSVNVPIGLWNLEYSVALQGNVTAATTAGPYHSTLSTANNSESDADFTCTNFNGGASGAVNILSQVYKRKIISLTAKATYYLNTRTTSASQANINNRGDLGKTVIRAICAYL